MMKRRQVFLNAVTTLAQVIGNAGILFFLYRFLIREIGIERLGILVARSRNHVRRHSRESGVLDEHREIRREIRGERRVG